MDTPTSDVIMHDGAASRRLVVLVALGDAGRAERLAASLAASDDLLPVVAGGGTADVAIVDDSSGDAVPASTPRVLLSGSGERPAGEVMAIMPAGADDLLLTAARKRGQMVPRIVGEKAARWGRLARWGRFVFFTRRDREDGAFALSARRWKGADGQGLVGDGQTAGCGERNGSRCSLADRRGVRRRRLLARVSIRH
ncbi:hypothetical protein ACFSOZ_19620 [Mesorhizobium newzealandense]|uniref:Helix-turn-helix transcriptional regulator n=1 Tax=Mesorhizobium newzealandense TaxID=1300302 RepID=A0ABW4UAP8_9HYPH